MRIGIIPARMGSSRFPGKPLVELHGYSMLEHCYYRAKMCTSLDEVFIATPDEVIKDRLEGIGARVVMTSAAHERATERVAEACLIIERELDTKVTSVVMLQGDEPMVKPEMISLTLASLENSRDGIVNLYTSLRTEQEFLDPNEIKVVVSKNKEAIYFSREAIPSNSKYAGAVNAFKQVCIIPFTRDALFEFISFEESYLEKVESIDMLRWIENGKVVTMAYTNHETYSVDNRKDFEFVRDLMIDDDLIDSYDSF